MPRKLELLKRQIAIWIKMVQALKFSTKETFLKFKIKHNFSTKQFGRQFNFEDHGHSWDVNKRLED